jgi:hypothetical protein
MDPQHPTNPDRAAEPDDLAYRPVEPDARRAGVDAETDAAHDPVQAAVRTLLRNAPDPGPMPADLVRRIEDSLAQAAVRRAGDHELFDELGFGEPSATEPVDESSDTIVFPAPPDGEADHANEADELAPRRRRWTVVGAAAAGVAILTLGGAVLVNQTRSANDGLASIPPSGASGGSAGSVHVQVSTTTYTKDDLATKAKALLDSPGPDASVGDAPSAGPLVTQSGAGGCVNALGAADAGAVSIDIATYEGQAAAVVVVRRSDTTTVYAVQRDCGDGDAGIIQDALPVP